MHTLNHTIERNVVEADGRYLNTQGIQALEQYVQTYTTRLSAYQQLREHNDHLILDSLRKVAQSHPDLIQQHGARCKYDMTEVLRYIALSILKDDDIFFKEQMLSWLDTILLAYKRTGHCVTAYRYLQDAIVARLPAPEAMLTRPYIEIVIQALQSHA